MRACEHRVQIAASQLGVLIANCMRISLPSITQVEFTRNFRKSCKTEIVEHIQLVKKRNGESDGKSENGEFSQVTQYYIEQHVDHVSYLIS